ncbi:MAG TPA: phosphatidylserine/phosphatidylglycerophosphate/cardiolipin synthase family protein [Blastocatellia bacterium]|jgi:cardiolipin synthase
MIKMTRKRRLLIIVLTLVGVAIFLVNPIEESPKYGLDHDFAIESSEFLPSLAGLTNSPLAQGNRIDIFNNGDQFYPAMLEAVGQARRAITFECYIYWAGEIGRRFAQAMAAKARSGVTVKILLDAVGSPDIGDEILGTLKDSGCQVRWYHPLRWYSVDRVNNRTHRKSLVIDGRIGFTGGAGIADQWLGRAQDPEHWRDMQIRVEGPAVVPLQTGFAHNWLETTGELVSGDAFFPQPRPAGALSAQTILSDPETGSSAARIMYYLSIVCARKSILIANSYFVPDQQAIEILTDAERRGVDVKVMVAGVHNDNWIARDNSVRLYGKLLEAGVEIYEYDQTMLHHKYMVCDGVWSTLGTTSFDNRSFGLNDESNVCVHDRDFAAQLAGIFSDDLAACRRITLEEWRGRGVLTKLREMVASLLRDQV